MKVELLNLPRDIHGMELNAAYGMLICHAKTDKLAQERPETFLKKAIKAGHESVLEHINLTYEIRNLSRACLQELARHRHISLSVESTRHTLRERAMQIEEVIGQLGLPEGAGSAYDIAVKIITECPEIDNDELKYIIPECWPTNLVMTVNVRELRHILKLRTSPAALKEFQELAHKLFEAVPDEFKYLLEDCVHD